MESKDIFKIIIGVIVGGMTGMIIDNKISAFAGNLLGEPNLFNMGIVFDVFFVFIPSAVIGGFFNLMDFNLLAIVGGITIGTISGFPLFPLPFFVPFIITIIAVFICQLPFGDPNFPK